MQTALRVGVFATGSRWRLFWALAVENKRGEPAMVAAGFVRQCRAALELVWASQVPLLLTLPLVHPVCFWLHLPAQAFAVARLIQRNDLVYNGLALASSRAVAAVVDFLH